MSGPRRIDMDVVRDQSLVRLNTNNPLGLTRDRKVTQDRRDVSRLTQTDVSQARSRRARALSILQVAKADLKSSRAERERIIGRRPGNLSSLAPPPDGSGSVSTTGSKHEQIDPTQSEQASFS